MFSEFTEEVYEGQTRLPGSHWDGTFVTEWWADNKGNDAPHKDELECREGWQWLGEWEIDTNRAVDDAGWEYGVDTNIANWGPVERGYHLSRRRRWQRRRNRLSDEASAKLKDFDPEGWEYSKIFTTKFHPKERKFDMVRRRRYNRKLVSSVPMPIVFKITKEEAKKDQPAEVFNMAPRIITEYDDRQVHKYQLRAYIYQARGVLGADPTGYSDPYARVIFGNRSASTHVIDETVSPVWDSTLVLNAVEICGYPEDIASNPPYIVVELYDEDVLDHDKLGRVVCKPTVFNSGMYKCTKLTWFPIGGTKRSKGDLLAAFEMFKLGGIELPHLPPFQNMRYLVPSDIRPRLQLTRVEVLTWGVRLMKDYRMIPVESPHVDIEVGGKTLTIEKIDSVRHHPNFASPHAYVDVELPILEEYLPPINLRIMDNRTFGYTPLVAVSTIKEYGQYRCHYNLLEKEGAAITEQQDKEDRAALFTNILATQIDPAEMMETEIIGEDKMDGNVGVSANNALFSAGKLEVDVEGVGKRGSNGDVVVDIEPAPRTDSRTSNESGKSSEPARKLSRKETRKIKKFEEEEQPHPDDILVSDWWSKYYQSIGADPRLDRIFKERSLPTIKLYDEELETDHNHFRDLMEVIPLQRPDNERSSDEEEEDSDEETHNVGLFKGSFKIYPITEDMRQKAESEPPKLMFSNLPNNKSCDVLVRLYVVAGMNLTPLDFGGSVDPYLYVKCGRIIHDDKAHYQTKKINPMFGKMFETRASLPRDSKMVVKVYDHDLIGSNDLIGGTIIDLEDRFLSWRRASCGVSTQYIIEKESKDRWRDFLKPIALLKRMCLLKGWAPPTFKGKGSTLRCYINGHEYKLRYFESSRMPMNLVSGSNKKVGSDEHRLALHVLHELGVVPEHVETRTLYNDDCPGIPQGKLHLWVDIFPYDRNLPPPVNITPRVAKKMVLRVIIWNTQDVKLDDTNIMGEQMSDIFVRCHVEGMKKDSQETDVHYRSLTGEGNFNWRMVYNFDYLMAEQKIVLWERQSFFSVEKSEEKRDPILHIRVFDYDIFSSDDLLGWTELNLVSLPSPTKGHKECNLGIYDTPQKDRISIFDKKKIKGFWPVYDDSMGERELTGKVEIEIEVLSEEEAEDRPAGKARDEPNSNPTLEPPNRPETSFNWFTNPLMVFKILIWGRYKWKILFSLLILLLIVFLGLLIYTSPQAITTNVFSG